MTALQPSLFGPDEWVMFCDGARCEASISDPDRSELQRRAKAAGWAIAGGELCPACREAA